MTQNPPEPVRLYIRYGKKDLSQYAGKDFADTCAYFGLNPQHRKKLFEPDLPKELLDYIRSPKALPGTLIPLMLAPLQGISGVDVSESPHYVGVRLQHGVDSQKMAEQLSVLLALPVYTCKREMLQAAEAA